MFSLWLARIANSSFIKCHHNFLEFQFCSLVIWMWGSCFTKVLHNICKRHHPSFVRAFAKPSCQSWIQVYCDQSSLESKLTYEVQDFKLLCGPHDHRSLAVEVLTCYDERPSCLSEHEIHELIWSSSMTYPIALTTSLRWFQLSLYALTAVTAVATCEDHCFSWHSAWLCS